MLTPDSAFYLLSEKSRSGISHWRAYFTERDPDTGIEDDGSHKSQSLAHRAVNQWIENGCPSRSNRRGKGAPVAQGWVLDDIGRQYWAWDSSPYLRAILSRDPLAIRQEHANAMAGCYSKHVQPVLGALPFRRITPAMLDDLVTDLLTKKKLSTQTAKHVVASMAPIFEQARKQGLIVFDPIKSMMKITVRLVRPRQPFSVEETRKLLDWDNLETIWAPPGNQRYHPDFNPHRLYALTLMTAVTGTRVGTVVPVDCSLLDPVLPYLPTRGYLFPSWGRHGVLTPSTARRLLRQALERIGISRQEQKKRGLGFHSFRHTWVTRTSASGLSDDVQSGFTEHRDDRTCKRYRHLDAGDMLSALEVQRTIAGVGR